MRLSRYIKQFHFPEDPEYLLLYSTKTTSTVLAHKSVLTSVEDNSVSHADKKTLSDLGFLVNNTEAERNEAIAGFDNANKKNRAFEAIVILNLDCNLDCVYCYEGDLKGRLYMTRETADHLVAFIEKHYISKVDEIDIGFYGGEPLLSLSLIKYISKRLNILTAERGLKYTFGLVTNGTLLTKKMARELSQLGLERARITIDGPADNHNRFRPFATGSGSFDVIIKNIKEVCELTKISVGGNFTRENYTAFPELMDYLIKEGITPETLASVRFDAVTPSPFKRSELMNKCSAVEEPWVFEAGLFLREEIMKRGFRTPKLRPQSCQIEIDNSLTINHDGGILKCTALMGWKGFEAGNIRTGITDYRESYKLDVWKNKECADCEYLPLCYGGCRYTTLLQDGKIERVDCRRPYYDANLEALIKQDLQYSSSLGLAQP